MCQSNRTGILKSSLRNIKMSAERDCDHHPVDGILSLLKEVAEKEDIHDYKIESACGSLKGDGYLGEIQTAKVVGKSNADKPVTLNLVIKSAPKSDALRKQVPLQSIYEREVFVYGTVFPIFAKLEAEIGLTPSAIAPKFYKGCTVEKNERIIMEDLKESGFKLYERRKPMDDDHVTLIMGAYGRLHALSFALRDKNQKLFGTFGKSMDNMIVEYMRDSDLFYDKCNIALDVLNPETDAVAIKEYKHFLNNIKQFATELLEAPNDYFVVLHGDCWTSNMMFKYDDKSNPAKPTESRFIDFQISRPASPVLDLSYFFYACSSKEIIDRWDHYLKLYHNSLSTHLLQLGCDPGKLFPYSVLQQHWKLYAKFGLIMAMQIIYVMYTETDEVDAYSKAIESGKTLSQAFDHNISNIDKCNVRIRDVILHFVKNKLM